MRHLDIGILRHLNIIGIVRHLNIIGTVRCLNDTMGLMTYLNDKFGTIYCIQGNLLFSPSKDDGLELYINDNEMPKPAEK